MCDEIRGKRRPLQSLQVVHECTLTKARILCLEPCQLEPHNNFFCYFFRSLF